MRRDERQRAAGRWRGAFAALLLASLFALHQDGWLWREPRLVLGLPAGLAYHVAYCVAASLVLALAVRWLWPREADAAEAESEAEEGSRA